MSIYSKMFDEGWRSPIGGRCFLSSGCQSAAEPPLPQAPGAAFDAGSQAVFRRSSEMQTPSGASTQTPPPGCGPDYVWMLAQNALSAAVELADRGSGSGSSSSADGGAPKSVPEGELQDRSVRFRACR